MRITIAGGPLYPIPALDGGSVPRMWHGLAEQFARRNHAVIVCAKADSRQQHEETVNGVRYKRRGGFQQSEAVWWDLARGLLDSLFSARSLPAGDILITNDFWLPTLAPLLRSSAGQVVVNANRYPKHQYTLYRHVASVVAASRAVADAITAQTPRLIGRVEVIPNALDLSVFRRSATRFAAVGQLQVLYVGRIHPEKGLELLIDATRKLMTGGRNVLVKIVGPHLPHHGGGGQRYLDSLRVRALSLPIEFIGPVFEPERLAKIYGDADVFCYPSLAEHGESFPVAPVEAMASGAVPVVSRLECFEDLIAGGDTGSAFEHRGSGAASRLADQIAFLDDDRPMLARMKDRAKERAEDFGLEPIAERYLTLFQRLGGR